MYKTFLKNGPNQLINKRLKTNYNPLGLKSNRIKSFLIRYIKISLDYIISNCAWQYTLKINRQTAIINPNSYRSDKKLPEMDSGVLVYD